MMSKTFLGLIAGAAVGVTAGILLAPNKGKKTRKKLSKEAHSIKKDLVNEVTEVTETMGEIYDSQKKVVSEHTDTVLKKASYKADYVITKLEETLKELKSKNKKYHEGMA